jgi:peptidoglycan hydrolase-like protein with peptidoglycan-binding domain
MKVPKNQVKIVDNKTYQAQDSVDLAQMVLDGITSLGFNNRGVRDSNYYVTKYTNMPSILIEAGFMTNSNDLERITNEEIQEKIAYKISDAVYKYFETDEKNKRKSFGHIRDLEFIISNKYALVGQAIELRLDGIKNYDDYVYKLEIKKDNKEVYSNVYGTEYSYKFTPQDDGIYDVTFYLKQKESTKEYDDKISGNFIVFKSPKIKDVIMSVQRMDVNKPIVFNVVKEFGTIEGVDYSFDVYLNDKKIESNTSSTGIFSFTPKSEGEYKLVVYLRDKLSNQKFDDMFETKFVVGNYKDISRGGNPPSENTDNKEQNEQKEKTNQQESLETVMQIKYTRPLRLGISGQDVNELQEALKRLGYLKIDKTTTYFGNMTRDAVMAFQRANKLTVDGIAGPNTISKINEELNKQVKKETEKEIKTEDTKNTTVSENKATTKMEETVMQIKYTRPLRLGIRGQDVKELQEALKRLGYLKIDRTTTYYGYMTRDAVMAFQRANKLAVDGVAGPNTISKINEKLNNQVKRETEKEIKTEDTKNTTVSENKATTKMEETVMQIKYTRPLRLGIRGQDVKELQEALKRLGYLKIDRTTTYYGYMTRDAVMAFQRANKLAVDGVVGPNTIKVINKKLK